MKKVTITAPGGESITTSEAEAELYRAMWRAFPDTPRFRVGKTTPRRGNLSGVLAYEVTVEGVDLPWGFVNVLVGVLGKPDPYNPWFTDHDPDGPCTRYTFDAALLRDVIHALGVLAGTRR